MTPTVTARQPPRPYDFRLPWTGEPRDHQPAALNAAADASPEAVREESQPIPCRTEASVNQKGTECSICVEYAVFYIKYGIHS